jgi:hypothetical protein
MKNGQALEQWARREVAALGVPEKQRRAMIVALMKAYQVGVVDCLSDALKRLGL